MELQLIQRKIYAIRGFNVMLDSDLAKLYGIEVKQLNLAVKRNIKRFPLDFMFQLNKEENGSLRFQIETLKNTRGAHSKYLPYAFTEHGIAMLSGILNSDTAIQVNIDIIRAFIALRQYYLNYKDILRKVNSIEDDVDAIFKTLDGLVAQKAFDEKPPNRIGFRMD
jgi:phage regulator Rha-like protein